MRAIVRILPVAVMIASIMSCGQTDPEKFFREEKWDEYLGLMSRCRDSLRIVDISHVNIALASSGRLADDAFGFIQAGFDGILPEWNRGGVEGECLALMYYQAGHMALARRMAFETEVCDGWGNNAGMLKLLVKTNIIYGDYKIALKYILELEKAGGDIGRWAEGQRRYLWNDALVESDPEYGPKRLCIPDPDFQSAIRGIDRDFMDIIAANPRHRNTVEVLGVCYLLDCDFESFRAFLDKYYGTEALEALPRSFQEAACFLSQLEPGYWRRTGVSREVHKQYVSFLDRLGKGLDMKKFENTYWHYVMRLNEK